MKELLFYILLVVIKNDIVKN